MSRLEKWFLLGLLVFAAVLRLWNFVPFMEFLDDQGRDAIVAKHILIDHELTLLGPSTSVGKMYLGPLYYYWMVPFLAMTYPSPVGPAYAVAMLGIATIGLTYVLGKKVVGPVPAAVGAILLAAAPPVVQLSRFSWQPNPAPFVGVILFYALWQTLRRSWKWWIVVAICQGILLHLHYVTLLTLVPVGILWLYEGWQKRKTQALHGHIVVLAVFLGVMILAFSPLVLFDLRHQGLIREGFAEFFQDQRHEQSLWRKITQTVLDMHGRGMYTLVEIWGISKEQRMVNTGLLGLLCISIVLALGRQKRQERAGVLYVGLWMVSGVVGLSAYQGTIYPHYFGFLFPMIALFVGVSLSWFLRSRLAGGVGVGLAIIAALFMANSLPYFHAPPVGIRDVQSVSTQILQNLPAHVRYNIALLNDNREYKGNKYRYFLEVSSTPPQNQYSYDHLDYLVVVVENGENPTKTPIYEVQQFVGENQGHPLLMTEQDYQGIVKTFIYKRL